MRRGKKPTRKQKIRLTIRCATVRNTGMWTCCSYQIRMRIMRR